MATPSSSSTTPSPTVAIHAPGLPPPRAPLADGDTEDRMAVVHNLMKRVEVSKLTSALRARLSYASYKVAHNASKTTMPTLEAQAVAPPQPIPATSGKRKAASTINYYSHPAAQASTSRRSMTMASASGSSSSAQQQRTMYYPNIPSGLGPGGNSAAGSNSSNATSTLFSSILAPPPNKRARTVLNPSAPPTSPPTRAVPAATGRSPRQPAGSPRTTKGKKADKSHKATPKSKLTPKESEEIDRKAAEVLTSLLRSRPAGAMSPHSSVSAGSDIGSQASMSFAPPSRASFSGSTHLPGPPRSMTPTQALAHQQQQQQAVGGSTPRSNKRNGGLMSDNEAAENMLFLATSPSPVRASASRDAAAYRHLSELRNTGRVLFSGGGAVASSASLTREAGGSLSSISSQMGVGPVVGDRDLPVPRPTSSGSPPHSQGSQRTVPTVPGSPNLSPDLGAGGNPSSGRHTPTMAPLPPGVGTASPSGYPSGPPSLSAQSSFAASSSSLMPTHHQPPTPGNTIPFNIGDFINISPSPATTSVVVPPSPNKTTLVPNLRKDVGRKLFEEEQQRGMQRMEEMHTGHPGHASHASHGHGHGASPGHSSGNGLGAGIDLVRT